MEAESYGDPEIAAFIERNFLPVEAHIKEHPAWFHRFEVPWTPTVLLLDPGGRERVRLEGYLDPPNFRAALEGGLGRIAFLRKKYADAERWYDGVATGFAASHFAPEAIYWRAVARYSATHDHTILRAVAEDLRRDWPGSLWTLKASPWLPA